MREIVIKAPFENYEHVEAYRTLRTNIEFSGDENRVIAVTSCTPSEGKSTVALSLALSLTEDGKKVLLIDADMRRSVMVGKHKVEDGAGLSACLSGQAKLEDVVCKTQYPELMVILAGHFPPNPAELLGNSKLEKLIGSFRKVFDYIIIDTPPLGSVIDAAVVAKNCDASILVIQSGVISRKYAFYVKRQLQMSGCKILGVVLNRVDTKTEKYYEKYYGK